ncbi:MAG: DNA (cytosine-5-)-methyltransferase [Polyangiaceae bacterium]
MIGGKRMSSESLSTVGLFSGVGGFELGFQRAGHRISSLCEIDEAAASVLSKRFRDVTIHRDVRTLSALPAGTDAVLAGFPCQDLSQAGRMLGLAGHNSGLVSEVFRLLEKTRVPHVLIENVPNMLRVDRGAAMASILDRLEALGYAWAYRVIDTRSFGLPQRRHRVFLLASRELRPEAILLAQDEARVWPSDDHELDAKAYGFYWTEGNSGIGWTKEAVPPLKGGSGVGIPSPPAIWLRSAIHALPPFVTPGIELAESMHGLPKGWTKCHEPTHERRRWRMVGNAVSVPVATWIGRRLGTAPRETVPEPKTRLTGTAWPTAAFGSRKGRFAADAGMAPRAFQPRLLWDCVKATGDVAPLSWRAAAGFERRLKASSLRAPSEFRESLRAYVNDSAEAQAAE